MISQEASKILTCHTVGHEGEPAWILQGIRMECLEATVQEIGSMEENGKF